MWLMGRGRAPCHMIYDFKQQLLGLAGIMALNELLVLPATWAVHPHHGLLCPWGGNKNIPASQPARSALVPVLHSVGWLSLNA